jgi:fermentation-respiration switch protein FrsA (DUF1100 family)
MISVSVALFVLALVLCAYLGIAIGLWRFQERIVFQPPRVAAEDSTADLPRLSYVAADGVPLFAHVVGAGPGRGLVVAFHGNAVVARWLIPWARQVASRFEVCVVLPEYRGYDGLTGRPTYSGAALDSRAGLAAACAHVGADVSSVVLFGHSLGSAIATELAAETQPRTLILQSPFTSARDLVSRWPVVGLRLGWSIISRVHYDTVARVRALDVPVHVAHGKRDIVIPARMGRTVFTAAASPGTFLLIPSAGHNDVAEAGGDAYWRWLGEAVRG